jgi:hypothetical protein
MINIYIGILRALAKREMCDNARDEKAAGKKFTNLENNLLLLKEFLC